MKSKIDLSPAEAAVALAALVSFADDEPSEAEGVVLRRYYRHATAEQLQAKLDGAGITYPHELDSIEPVVLDVLRSSPQPFRLRTIAVGWLLAEADGELHTNEVHKLAAYAEAMEVSLAEARAAAATGIPEVDELHDETAGVVSAPTRAIPDLSVTEAAVALAVWVGFADDDPSDAEAAVVREYFSYQTVESLQTKLGAAGLNWPADLPALKPAILRALRAFAREEQLRTLAVAWKVASADGETAPEESAIIERFCEEFSVGMAEVRTYFSSTPG